MLSLDNSLHNKDNFFSSSSTSMNEREGGFCEKSYYFHMKKKSKLSSSDHFFLESESYEYFMASHNHIKLLPFLYLNRNLRDY
jgi:hypothetical protein